MISIHPTIVALDILQTLINPPGSDICNVWYWSLITEKKYGDHIAISLYVLFVHSLPFKNGFIFFVCMYSFAKINNVGKELL